MREPNSILLIAETSQSGISAPVPGRGGGIVKAVYHLLGKRLSVETMAQYLMRYAEIAYGQRDIESLRAIAEILTGLPSLNARHTGLFYLGLVLKRQGEPRAQSIFESLIDSPSSLVRARSIQALGAVHFEASRFDEAERLHILAARAADPLTRINALFQFSFLEIEAGRPSASLRLLESIAPLVRQVAKSHPQTIYIYHNNLACDLLGMGRIAEAKAHSDIAISSPIAHAYPEWHDTAYEIVQAQARPLIFTVSAPAQREQGKRESNVQAFSSPLVKDDPSPIYEQLRPLLPLLFWLIKSSPPTGPPAALGAK